MRFAFGHLLTAGLCTAVCSAAASAGTGIVINEIRIDQNSFDDQEYFELKGPASTSLDGLTYIVLGDGAQGDSGVIEAVVDLTGSTIPADGHFLVAESSFNDAPDPYGVTPDLIAFLNFENSDNVTHMLVDGFTGSEGDDLDGNDDGVLDITPWSAVVDQIALVENDPPADADDEWFYGTETIGPEGPFVPGHVYRCETDGTWTIGRFDLTDSPSAIDTPGAVNVDCGLTPGTCGDVNAGDCFTANTSGTPSPACDDADCCNTVCTVDPFCCDVDWDGACAEIANFNCAGGDICGAPDSGGCFDPNGTPGCSDEVCCDTVCAIDPDCCDVAWDQACADLALQECLAGPGDWVINEIHADPAATVMGGDANGDGVRDSSEDEFLEIFNNSGTDQNIEGWSISDGFTVRHVFGPTIVPDQCAVVVFGGGTPTGTFGSAIVRTASTGALGLNNSGDTVTLLDGLSNIQAEATYGGEGGNDVSLTRDPDVIGPFVLHPTAGEPDVGTAWSPGTRFDGTNFAGCTPIDDMDMDGIADDIDNCPMTPNPDQADCDGDGQGDACEADANGNGVPDDCEITPPDDLVINEIRTNQPSSDLDEYFELKSESGAVSLDQLFYIVIGDGAGGSGVIEHVTNLTGSMTNASGLFVAAEDTFSLGFADLTVDLNFENSDNVTHLLVANFFGDDGDDLDTDDDGTLDSTPWLAIVDSVALVRDDDLSGDEDDMGNPLPEDDEHYYSPNVLGPEISGDFNFAPSHAYRCVPDGTWTIGNFDPFDMMNPPTDTPGAENLDCGPGDSCPGDIVGGGGPDPDGVVNVFDLLELLAQWGGSGSADIAGPAGPEPDGTVNVFDLLQMLSFWGPCPA